MAPGVHSLLLAPASSQELRGRARAPPPSLQVPKQEQKLTLGHAGNLKSENADVYGAKSALDSPTRGLHSSQGDQPQNRKSTACWFRGEGRKLTFYCPGQPEHPAQVEKTSMTFRVGSMSPAPFSIRHYKPLVC